MSRSPDNARAAGEAISLYRQTWAALRELIGQGWSFSGHERNCAFLNLPGGRFANISSSSGLDLIDDGRALATCDWDYDGQIDFWVSNRTAPRVRFLHNVSDGAASGAFVGLKMRGVTCNGDAIGARVEVQVKGERRPHIRTVRAGDGFLAQSSKWLHFGLGKATEIERVLVRWPGGAAEEFSGVEAGAHYQLTQATGVAQLRARPKRPLPETASEMPAAASSAPAPTPAATRTWIMGRVPMPKSEYTGGEGPRLLNLWSRTCSACLAELAEWTEHQAGIRRAGLDIVALSIDHLGGDSSAEDPRFLDAIGFPFTRGRATTELVNAMEIVHRTYVEWQQPLPVPASFLLDAKGRVAAIYKGRVPLDTLLEDVSLLKADLLKQRERAVPYPGRWASTPFAPNPNRVAATFERAGQEEQAMAYLKDFLAGARPYLQDQFGSPEQQLETVAVAHQLLGDLLMKRKRPDEAASVYANLLKLVPENGTLHMQIGEGLLTQNLARAALPHLLIAVEGAPDNANLLFNTGLASLGSGQVPQAIDHFQRALTMAPKDPATLYQLAVALEIAGRPVEAADRFRAALNVRPGWPIAATKLIDLILASQGKRAVGTLDEALALAEALCLKTKRKDPTALYALARVHLGAERRQQAAAILDEAIALAKGRQHTPLLRALNSMRRALGAGN